MTSPLYAAFDNAGTNLTAPYTAGSGHLTVANGAAFGNFADGKKVPVTLYVGASPDLGVVYATLEISGASGNVLTVAGPVPPHSDANAPSGVKVQNLVVANYFSLINANVLTSTGSGAALTGITQSQVAGLTTASSPHFAGATLGSGSGIAKLTAGVIGTATAGTDYAGLTANTYTGLQTGAIHDHGGTVFHVEAYRPPSGTDDQAVADAIAAADAGGGGTVVFAAKTYSFTERIVLPVDGNSLPRQHFFRLTGSGRSSTVTDDSIYDGTTLDFGGINESDGGYGCIEALGAGYLEIDRLTFLNSGSITDPYIYVTNTVLHCEKNTFVGNTSLSATTCNQDAIQLGSATSSTTSTGSINSGFQGYGTVISHNMFQHIRRGVYCAIYSNGSVIRDNTWGLTCGGSSSYGAIEVMGISSAGTGGVVISGNLVELVGYIYGVRLSPYTVQCVVTDNTFWDGGAACVYIDNNSSGHVLISGTNPGGVPWVSSASGNYANVNTIVEQKLDGSGGICVGGFGIGAYNSVATEASSYLVTQGNGIGVGMTNPVAGLHVQCPNDLLRGVIVQAAANQQVPLFECRHSDGTPGVIIDQYDEVTAGAFIGTYQYFSENSALKWLEYVNGGTLYYRDLVNNDFLMGLFPGNPGFLQLFGSIVVGGGSLNVDGSYSPPTLVSTAAVNSSLFVGSDKSNALCWKDNVGVVHTINMTP